MERKTTAMQHSRHRAGRSCNRATCWGLENADTMEAEAEAQGLHQPLLGEEAVRGLKEGEQPRKALKSAGSRTLDSQE